jgi:hypothetical protein
MFFQNAYIGIFLIYIEHNFIYDFLILSVFFLKIVL